MICHIFFWRQISRGFADLWHRNTIPITCENSSSPSSSTWNCGNDGGLRYSICIDTIYLYIYIIIYIYTHHIVRYGLHGFNVTNMGFHVGIGNFKGGFPIIKHGGKSRNWKMIEVKGEKSSKPCLIWYLDGYINTWKFGNHVSTWWNRDGLITSPGTCLYHLNCEISSFLVWSPRLLFKISPRCLLFCVSSCNGFVKGTHDQTTYWLFIYGCIFTNCYMSIINHWTCFPIMESVCFQQIAG